MAVERLSAIDIQGPFTAVNTATTVETTLGTTTIPALSLTQPTSVMRVICFGTVVNNANVKTLKFYIGSSSTSFVLQASTANSWRIEATIVGTGNATQVSSVTVFCGTPSASTTETQTIATTQDGLSDIVVKVTGTATTTNDIASSGCLFIT